MLLRFLPKRGLKPCDRRAMGLVVALCFWGVKYLATLEYPQKLKGLTMLCVWGADLSRSETS